MSSHIANPKDTKSKDLHTRHQLMFLNCCKESSERSPSTEVCLCNYFKILHDTNRYSPGTFWCTCSTLWAHVSCTPGVNIKYFVRLNSLIKNFTIDHVKKKNNVFRYEETHKVLTDLFSDYNSKDSQCKIG